MKVRDRADSMAQPVKENRKPMLKSRRNWYLIKIILGAYLIYLSWQIGSGIFNDKVKDHVILLGIVTGVFCIFGVLLIILNIHSVWIDRTPDDEDILPIDKTE
jgi:hypothetical protein